MIEGLSHLTFIVSNLDRMANLLETMFDAREVYSSGDQTFPYRVKNSFWSATSGSR
jgi:hypothetical protein